MKSVSDSYTLHNGVKIPCIGLGTWKMPNTDSVVSVIREALKLGYRHIDTAAAYGNEESVGLALKQCGMSREKIFITSKLQNPMHGYENTMTAFEQTLKKLDTHYLDLYLIHWPNPIKYRDCWQKTNAETWKALEKLYTDGRIRAIGISNFLPHHIEALMQRATILPMVNQIMLCPGITQADIAVYCKERNILLEAYSPFGSGLVFKVPEMQALAKKYKKTIAQISLRWSLQMGFLPLPKSVTPDRLKENTKVFDFELSQEDVSNISSLKGCCGEMKDPDNTSF